MEIYSNNIRYRSCSWNKRKNTSHLENVSKIPNWTKATSSKEEEFDGLKYRNIGYDGSRLYTGEIVHNGPTVSDHRETTFSTAPAPIHELFAFPIRLISKHVKTSDPNETRPMELWGSGIYVLFLHQLI